MIGPPGLQDNAPLRAELAEAERLIGIQDERIIAGLRKGIDTIEAEDKAAEMRAALESIKTRARKR
jgi:hypothetical protein